MDYEAFKALVKDMRAAQKIVDNYVKNQDWDKAHVALQRSKALEKRVDDEIAAAERQESANDPDCIVLADGRRLVQGNLFEQP